MEGNVTDVLARIRASRGAPQQAGERCEMCAADIGEQHQHVVDVVGGTADGARHALTGFASLPHRVALVVDAGGVRWYDDSKATTPASVVAGVSGACSVVRSAGGCRRSPGSPTSSTRR